MNRYKVSIPLVDGFDVIDTHTGQHIERYMTQDDAEVLCIALNNVEVTANAYVAAILRKLDGGAA